MSVLVRIIKMKCFALDIPVFAKFSSMTFGRKTFGWHPFGKHILEWACDQIIRYNQQNVCQPNVCCLNVCWPNVCWPNVCWPNVCWPNVCWANVCWPNFCQYNCFRPNDMEPNFFAESKYFCKYVDKLEKQFFIKKISSELVFARHLYLSPGTLLTTLKFLHTFTNGPNKLECYITTGWKGLQGQTL